MASPSGFNSPLVYNARREQMYFPLAPEEIERLRRFGEVRRFAPGDYLVHAGETGLGMTVILEGRVNVTRRDGLGHDEPVVSYRPGHFIAEVGQLSGRAAFVDARALGEVEALVIPPTGLRALVIAVYNSSRVSSRESSCGRSTVTSVAWLPWLLWIVIACMVSTSDSLLVENSTAPCAPAITARSTPSRSTVTPVSPLYSPSP